jgi:hypothetical protein
MSTTLIGTIGKFTPDNLIAGDYPIKAEEITLVSGQNLVRGALLGQITTGGKYALSLSTASDGSQTPCAILADTTDASLGDIVCVAYRKGEFNKNAMTFGAAHTFATVKDALFKIGIILRDSIRN